MKSKSRLASLLVTMLAGAAVSVSPAAAHDGRNAALIGGLIAGALVGVAAGAAQGHNPPPRYYYSDPPFRHDYGYRPYPPAYYPTQYCGRYPYPPCRY